MQYAYPNGNKAGTQYEPGHSISCKIACVPSEDSDQPVDPRSLIRVFAGHTVGTQVAKASSVGRRKL